MGIKTVELSNAIQEVYGLSKERATEWALGLMIDIQDKQSPRHSSAVKMAAELMSDFYFFTNWDPNEETNDS
jgi:hypothetical protein